MFRDETYQDAPADWAATMRERIVVKATNFMVSDGKRVAWDVVRVVSFSV